MEMLCPECLTPLVSQDDSIAICPTHGGAFRVLYNRYTILPAQSEATTAPAEAPVEPKNPSQAASQPEPVLSESIQIHESAPEILDEPVIDVDPVVEEVTAQIEEPVDISIPEIVAEPEPVVESPFDEEPLISIEIPTVVEIEPKFEPESSTPVQFTPEDEHSSDADLIETIEPEPLPEQVEEEFQEFIDQPAPGAKSPSALEAVVGKLVEEAPDTDFGEQPFDAGKGAAGEVIAAEAPKAEFAPEPPATPVAAPPAIPTPPPRPTLSKGKTRAQPKADAVSPRVPPPMDPFEVALPAKKPLPAAAFGAGVEIPGSARSAAKPKLSARSNKLAVSPKLPPLPPPPPPMPVWDGPRPVREPAHAPTAQPQRPTTIKPRKLGSCKIHKDVPAIAACRSCGAGVCVRCDTVLGDNVHLCPSCKSAKALALAAGRRKMAKWSVGLAIWSGIGLALLASGATRGFAGTESALDIVILVLTVVWIFSQIAGLALAVVSYSGKGKNPAIVWIAIVLNIALIGAWVMPFLRIIRRGQE